MYDTSIQQKIREYLVSSYVPENQAQGLQSDDDLLLVLNSLQLLRMVIDIEGMFGVSIDNNEMTPENLGTIENIASFVQRKQAG